MTTSQTAGPPAAAPAAATTRAPAGSPDNAPRPTRPGLPGRLSGWSASARSGLEGTPGRLTALAVLTVLASLLFGLVAAYSFRAADGALTRAGANTDQLVRVQAIQTKLIQADADATNAFLVGGLEPAEQRADYNAAVTSASKLIAEAARRQPADGPALSALNEALLNYTTEIEQARSNNRQALPVGAQYLRNASADLRADALPLLTNLVVANNQRVSDEFGNVDTAILWLVLSGVVSLLVLVLGLIWLARRTRRYVNVPMAASAVIVLVTLFLGAVGLASIAGTVDDVRDGVYAATFSTAEARIAGFDAKSNESLTLVARGSGAAFEDAWKKSDTAVRGALSELDGNPISADLDPLPWDPYAKVHQQIRKLDDSGNWDGAVALATGTEAGSGNATFSTFDTSSDKQLSSLSQKTASQLDDAGGWLTLASVLAILAGIVAAVSAWWGVALRLEEYR